MSVSKIRVIKVGGSLLEFDGLVDDFRRWLPQQAPMHNVLIAGGGRFADEIRRADARFAIGQETSHWLCISQLHVTARLLHAILPETLFIQSFADLEQALRQPRADFPIVFSPEQYLRDVDPVGSLPPLPHTWAVTTDSIAARISQAVGADELVLLKSTAPPADREFSEPFVDAHFPQVVRHVAQVRWLNLRASREEA